MIRKFLPLLALLMYVSSCTNSKATSEKKDSDKRDTLQEEMNSAELKQLNELLKSSPNDAHLFYKRGTIYLGFKDYTAAIEDANRALKIDSLQTDSFYLLLTDASFRSGQTRRAKESLERCLKNIPKSTKAELKLAELYFFVKKYPESILHINNALKIDQNIALGYFLKGMCYKESGDTALAVSSMQTACELDDKYYDAFAELGSLLAAKKSTLCIEYFNTALRIKPQNTEIMYLVGKFYQDTKRIPQAIDAYTKLLAIDPKNKHALYNLGAIQYVFLKDPEKAKTYFTKAIDVNAEYAEAYLARGICYEETKNRVDAEADYRMAVQLKTNYEDAIDRLNSILDKKKNGK